MTISKELTPREREALALAADGNSNDDIAAKMGVARSTAKSHLAAAYGKLGAVDRTNAVHIAWQLGVLPHVVGEVTDFFASDVEVK